jgi:hypothetical protein
MQIHGETLRIKSARNIRGSNTATGGALAFDLNQRGTAMIAILHFTSASLTGSQEANRPAMIRQ